MGTAKALKSVKSFESSQLRGKFIHIEENQVDLEVLGESSPGCCIRDV